MALNLKRELAKSGYRRKSNKSLIVNKVKKIDNKEIIEKNNILFEDPKTFLQLPNETNFNFIVNKIPRGPQYDLDDKLIPFTMVGNPKYIKANKYANSSRPGSKRISFISRVKEPNIIKLNNFNNYYNIISDKEIKEIFNNYKNKIKENKGKYKNDLISDDECSKVMKQYMDKTLTLQEKCLKRNEYNINKFKNMEDYIQQKMKLKAKSNRNRISKYSMNNNSISKDINIGSELIMNSGDEYRLKKEAKTIIENRKSNLYALPNVSQNWEMSLRRPKNLNGIRKEILNYGTQKSPLCFITCEKAPQMNEYISKPRKDINYSSYGALFSRTNSIQNLYNNELIKNKTNDDICKNYIKRNSTCDTLEIQGQKLIDVEENICRKLKGKKKLLNIRNNKEEVKDITILANYTYNNFHIKLKK